jgi:hypothetical protein
MEETIKVGDLVAVVNPCPYCANIEYIGKIFRVDSIETGDYATVCCNKGKGMMGYWDDKDDLGYFRSELKKIPPLDELEGIRSQEDKPVEVT